MLKSKYFFSRLVSYLYEDEQVEHHVIGLKNGRDIYLLSEVNCYLGEKSKKSFNTSAKYERNLKSFFEHVYDKYSDYKDKFWTLATTEDLKSWQKSRVIARDERQFTTPTDKTIHSEASLVHSFYSWCSKKFIITKMNSDELRFHLDFKKESMLSYTRSAISVDGTDHSAINVTNSRAQDNHFSKSVIFTAKEAKSIMLEYSDPVYAALFMLAAATGLREEGVCKLPYIGFGDNAHIRPYPEMIPNMLPGDRTFKFKVKEKGKTRTIDINIEAWKSVCDIYLPLYYQRRSIAKVNNTGHDLDGFFFLTKRGEPVTPKNISDTTYYHKAKLEARGVKFPWTFHDTRSFYATQYLVKYLKSSEIKDQVFNLAVAESLAYQLGHSDIETTYKHYIKKASLLMAVLPDRDGGNFIGSELVS